MQSVMYCGTVRIVRTIGKAFGTSGVKTQVAGDVSLHATKLRKTRGHAGRQRNRSFEQVAYGAVHWITIGSTEREKRISSAHTALKGAPDVKVDSFEEAYCACFEEGDLMVEYFEKKRLIIS